MAAADHDAVWIPAIPAVAAVLVRQRRELIISHQYPPCFGGGDKNADLPLRHQAAN